ncbi:MAG: hypothetical protein J0H66_03135 [Solirubrobacterales bacterium]|nr:hypothetical protein [Solirubrobacterales bacterium]OJU96098.1 MAG: hypothetical protein BGO23_00800 [Solirubrobacterales bacterium 67-14]
MKRAGYGAIRDDRRVARPEPETEEQFEREFRRAGLPLLTENYSASEDIFNRAVPLLGLVLILEVLGPLNKSWTTLGNVASVVTAILLMLVALGVINRMRGRPFFSLPRKVGRPELAAFVIVPALLPGIISGHWGIASLTALFNLGLLFLILGVVGFGLISIVRWALARLLGELSRSLGLLVKAVPLLMIFSLILFLTPELWQVFSQLPDASLLLLVGLFMLLGSAFLIARIPHEVAALEQEAGSGGPPLKPRQRFNVGLVLFVSQSLQVLLVALAVAVFFVIFGLLTIGADTVTSWTTHPADVWFEFQLAGREAAMTRELLRVATAIASFTGLYFAISMLTDDLYRKEFLSRITDEMEATFVRRVEYLKLIGKGDAS